MGSPKVGDVYIRGLHGIPEYEIHIGTDKMDWWWCEGFLKKDDRFIHNNSVEYQKSGQDLIDAADREKKRTMIIKVLHERVRGINHIQISDEFWPEMEEIIREGVMAKHPGNKVEFEFEQTEIV